MTQSVGVSWVVLVTGELLLLPVKKVESIPGADPKPVLAIFDNGINVIVSEAFGVFGVMIKTMKRVLVAVQSVQTATSGAEPQNALTVLVGGPYSVVT